MSLYELHRLIFDVNNRAEFKASYQQDREAVYQNYTLDEDELTALRTDDIYRLHKFGVNTFLLAPYALSLGHPLSDYGEILRAGSEAEQQQKKTSSPDKPATT